MACREKTPSNLVHFVPLVSTKVTRAKLLLLLNVFILENCEVVNHFTTELSRERCSFCEQTDTLPETNREFTPEKLPPQKEISSSNHQFSGAMLVSGRVLYILFLYVCWEDLQRDSESLFFQWGLNS